jgi:two-component system chemotaxis response regulator CheY
MGDPMAKTILIVDDTDISRFLAKRAIQAAGYEVIEANSAQAALNLLDGRSVSMAVCDFNMPGMDGIEFAQAVKEMQEYMHMPIMMLTVADDQEIRDRGKEAGLKAWMNKPFTPAGLVSAVDKLCP